MRPIAIAAVVASSLTLAAPAPSRAQAPTRSESAVVLDLDAVRGLAREASFDVRAAEARVDAARVEVRRAWAPLIPTVYAGASGTVFDREIRIPLPQIPGVDVESPVFQQSERFDLSVGFDTVLLDARTFPRADAAESSVDAARARQEAVAARVEWAGIELVYRIAMVDGLVDVAGRQVERQQAHVEAARRRLEARTGTRFELSRAESALVDAEVQRDDLVYSRRELVRALALLLDRPIDFDVAAPPEAPPRVDEERERAELRAATEAVDAARSARRAVTLDWVPRVFASGQYGWSTAEAIDGEQDYWKLTLGLRWTIFDHGLRRAARQDGEARLREAEVEAERARAEVAADLAGANDDLANAERRAEQAEVRLRTAERAVADAEAGFEAEVLTSLDVLDAEAARVAAENGVVAARLEVELARWRLAWAAGAL